ncbi:MAG: MBL fold metallo-hydrolase [Candidatus Peribacteria bacterium]|jgi:ribonuclease BN (tRNA processing enzyme)|nr:MBL fold metallo-hydrolase [Candidatus Peribacteria bacterium]
MRFLGRGSSFNPKEGNTSAFLKSADGETLFLIDCGSTVFCRLLDKGILEGVQQLHIALTHLHGDHAGSLSELISYAFWKMGVRPILHFPISLDDDVLMTFLRAQGIEDSLYSHERLPSRKIDTLQLQFKFFPVPHADPLWNETFALWLQIGDEKIYYSGDTNRISCLEGLQRGEYDRVYHECSTWEESPVHVPYGRLLATIPQELRGKIWLMHLDEDFDFSRAKSDGFNVVELI